MIACCIGRKEQGKSTLGYFLAYKAKANRVIFDPREHYSTSENPEPDSSQLYDLLSEREEIIVQVPFHVPQHFELTCNALMAYVRDKREQGVEVDFGLLVDEAYDAKTFENMPDSLDWLMRKTKSSQAHIVFTAHQTKHLATDIRALANHFFLFQITQEHDLRAIEDRCGREVAEMLPGLGPRQIVHWDDDKQTFERVTNPKAWYIDIHANQQQRKKPDGKHPDTAEAIA